MNAEGYEPQSLAASNLSKVISTIAGIVRPPPKRFADEWADANRELPPDAPEPGPWRSSRLPYMIPICRAFSDRGLREIVVVTGAQMGKTETIFNIIGHRFDDGPRVPVLYIGPTQKNVKSISQDRFKKLLASTKSLAKILEPGQRDAMYEKFLAGVRLGFGWAGSATELATHPAGLAIVDERDRMDDDVSSEGDPVVLVSARVKNYRGVVGVFSTPTIDGASAIQREYMKGTLERWAWPCVHCGEYFIPTLELLTWPEKANAQEARAAACVACPECGGTLTTLDRDQVMNAAGKFIPHRIDETDESWIPLDEVPDNSIRSFWINGLASPWVSFGEIAELLVNAYASGDQDAIQAVVNTWGGEWYRMKGDRPAYENVLELREGYAPRTLPDGVQFLTMGVDVQKLGLYYVVRGWGFNVESWLLAHGYIAGETAFDNVWILLARELSALYGDKVVSRCFVDSGYAPGDPAERPANQVYQFSRRHRGTAFATKGHAMQEAPVKATDIDVSVAGRTIKGGVRLFHLDTDYLKRFIYTRIRWPRGEAGAWHLHREVDQDYAAQVIAEECLQKSSGRRVWIRRGPNHYLDCEVNALAAALTLQVHALRPLDEKSKPPAPKDDDVKTPAPSFIRRESDGRPFIRSRH